MKLIRTVMITAMVVALSVTTAAPASATEGLDPAKEIDGGDYTITLTPSERSGSDPSLGPAINRPPDKLTISKGCPAGFRDASRTFIVAPSWTGIISDIRNSESAAYYPKEEADGWGLTGKAISLIGGSGYSFNFEESGTVDLVVVCAESSSKFDIEGMPADQPYFVASVEVDVENDSWKQVPHNATNPEPPAPPTGETTIDAASSAVTATSATLTANITPAEATGTVTFTSGDITQTATVESGVASVSVSGLTPETEYTFTVEYAGDDNNKPASGTITLTTSAGSGSDDSSDSDVVVTVPPIAEAGGLTLSVDPAAITLTSEEARFAGAPWTAVGATGPITVIDDRKDVMAVWSLDGKMSNLTSGGETIEASSIGWTPEFIKGTGQAGPAVTVSEGGLSEPRNLATGPGSDKGNVVTVVSAGLIIEVSPEKAGGNYTGTLTLTLT